jgi:site-specific DNA-methyltransferase (adenine-specific)
LPNWGLKNRIPHSFNDTGGASRFFYCAKASAKERAGNDWPTVKPLALMRWLCRLITPPGGRILDPFHGSGSTLLAARDEGFDVVGIDKDEHAREIAMRRLGMQEAA